MRQKTIRNYGGLWLAILCITTGDLAAKPEKVGDLGSPSSLQFEGVKSFPEDAIRRTLRSNPIFIRTSHPAAPYAEFREKLVELVHRGYLNEGFPDAKVEADFIEAEKAIRVKVNEGPRFRSGELVIDGATGDVPKPLLKKMLTEATDFSDPMLLRFLRNRNHFLTAAKTLTLKSRENATDAASEEAVEADSPIKFTSSINTNYFGYAFLTPNGPIPPPGEISYDPSDDVAWEKGEPVSFVDAPAEKAAKSVDAALEELGYFSATAKAETEINPVAGTMDLRVKVTSLGPRATLGDIRIDGLERHDADQVAAFLGLEKGTHFNRALLIETERKLIESGRFITHWIEIQKQEDGNTFDLTLTVSEFLAVPKLGEPLSPEEAAAIRFARWMSTIPDRDEDLICTLRELPKANGEAPPIPEIRVILSPTDGLGILAGDGPENALVFGKEHFGVYQVSGSRKARSVSPPYEGAFIPQVTLFPNGESQTANTINLFFSAKSQRPSHLKSPLETQFYVAPVAGLQILYGKSTRAREPKPGVLEIQREDEDGTNKFEIDMETGRLLSMTTVDVEDDVEIEIASLVGALRNELADIRAATDSLPNGYDENRPVGSLFGPVVRSLLENDVIKEMLAGMDMEVSDSLVRHLDDADVMAPFEAMMLSWWRGYSSKGSFSIPITREEFDSSTNQLVFGIATGMLGSAEPLLPKDSWLWKVVRETIHLFGNSPHTPEMLDELDSDAVEMGPVGYLVTARVLKMMQSPQAYRFAWGGLERLEATDFQDDWHFLFDPESPAEITTRGVNLIEALGKISADTTDPETRELGQKLIKAVASYREGKPDEFLEQTELALAQLWEDSGQAAVEELLRTMVGLPETVSMKDLAAAVDDMPILHADVRAAAFFDDKNQEEALNSQIAEKPFLALFGKLGGKFPPEMIDQQLDRLVANRFDGNKATLKAALEKASVSLDELKQVIGTRIVAEAIRGKVLGETPEPTEEKMKAFLRENPEAITLKPAVHLHTIAVEKNDNNQRRLEAARKKIANGEKKFAEVAKKLSQDSKASAGGDWGWVTPSHFNETLAARIAACETTDPSPVFEDGKFYRLIQVSERRGKGPATLEQLDAKARETLAKAIRVIEARKWEAAQVEKRYVKHFPASTP